VSTWEWPVPPANDDASMDLLWDRLRYQRDSLLAACDWRMLPDTPQHLRDGWAGYRQALRDLPANTTHPREVVWPTAPEQ
jgi:hypothetical protein